MPRLAIIEDTPSSIQAALASPEIRSIGRLLASADVTITKQVSIAELDAKLADKGLTTVQRIQIKASLSRAGLLR